jgi:DnaJ like chaperone protein
MGFNILHNVWNDKEWHEGLFQREQHVNEHPYDPLLEAYISIGALMVSKDTASYREKILYLNSYFSKNFPRTHYDFGRSFTESLKKPVRPQVISKWLRRKLPHQAQRIQVMYFLAGLSTVDGSMNKREVDLLREMNTLLELSPQDFDSIIAMYTQRQERTQSTANSRPQVSAIRLARTILNVSENASKEEIKQAHRRLVKLHHPDRFAKESIEQQKIAEQRFIEIQKAYELLEII